MLEDTATYYVERRDGYLGTEFSLPGGCGKKRPRRANNERTTVNIRSIAARAS